MALSRLQCVTCWPFFCPFSCLLSKEVKIKDLVKEQPRNFRPKPQKLISQSAALGGSAFSMQLQVLMLTNGFDFFFSQSLKIYD